VYLDLAPHSDTEVKVTWRNEFQVRRPYLVHRTQLESAAIACRTALEALGNEFRTSPKPSYGTCLRNLAGAGSLLYYLLFDGAATDLDVAEDVKQWLERLAKSEVQLTVTSDLAVQIPWSLVYAGTPPPDDTTGAPPTTVEAYRDFWGLKYSVATLCNSMPMWELDAARKRADFRLLLVLHESEYQAVLKLLDPAEVEYFARIVERPVGRAYSWSAAREKWRKISESDSLIYVLCHSNGSSLSLDHKDEINVTAFSQQFAKQRRGARGATLCFFNGCFTARGSLDNSFHVASQIPGFCGFVGTEAEIPPKFAGRFGLQFVYLLVECGMPVQEIVDKLRIAHWPLGLFYGCYAHPAFSIEASTEAQIDIGISHIKNAPRSTPGEQHP
jgi:hypothetical protein